MSTICCSPSTAHGPAMITMSELPPITVPFGSGHERVVLPPLAGHLLVRLRDRDDLEDALEALQPRRESTRRRCRSGPRPSSVRPGSGARRSPSP